MSGDQALVSIEEFRLKCGEVVGQSAWFTIDQPLVDRFADATDDHQYIHVDPALARGTAFGGTVAHGFLILSLLSKFHADAVPPLANVSVAINSGFDRVRFVSPVRTGSRIRAVFTLAECAEQKPGYWRTLLNAEVQIEGADKPALVAEWITIWGIAG